VRELRFGSRQSRSYNAFRNRAVKALSLSWVCRPFWCRRVDVLRSGRHSTRFLSSEMRSSMVFVLCRREREGPGPLNHCPDLLMIGTSAKACQQRRRHAALSACIPSKVRAAWYRTLTCAMHYMVVRLGFATDSVSIDSRAQYARQSH
jgi:hypothetical protein